MKILAMSGVALMLVMPGMSQEIIRLEFDKTVPLVDRGVFFKSVPPLACGPEGSIYALDNRGHTIIKIINDGREILKIGQHGQGPGDLSMPSLITALSEKLWVWDANGISMFQADGSFLHRFRVFTRIISLYAFDQGLMVAHTGQPKFICLYDFSGNRIREFGSKIDIDYEALEVWPAPLAEFMINQGKVFRTDKGTFFINTVIGDMSAYDRAGRLSSQQKLVDPKWSEELENVFLRGKPSKQELQKEHVPVFLDVKYFNGHFFCLVKKSHFPGCPGDILCFAEADGRLDCALILQEQSNDPYYQSFAIREDREGTKIILSGPDKSGEIKIDIYRGNIFVTSARESAVNPRTGGALW